MQLMEPWSDTDALATGQGAALAFGPQYYATHCGPIPYDRSEEHWRRFFGTVADQLIKHILSRARF